MWLCYLDCSFYPLGIGLAIPAMTIALLAAVPRSCSGIASGVLNTVRQAGGAIGVALFGTFLARNGVGGIQNAFITSCAVVAVAAVIALLMIHPAPET